MYIKFSFFEQLTNGDLKPACKILVNDVDYLMQVIVKKLEQM
jgi:hypothetical protein